METTTLPPPPPEAQLIGRRRKSTFPRLSMRQAAIAAGISPSAWAEVEKARRSVAPGVVVYKKGTAEIVAPMAGVLGITPAELRACDRSDAAAMLEVLLEEAEKAPTDGQRRMLRAVIARDRPDTRQ